VAVAPKVVVVVVVEEEEEKGRVLACSPFA
jgi:hypothetical protein